MLIIFLTIFVQTTHAESWDPWSVINHAPVIRLSADREPESLDRSEEDVQSIAATPFLWLLSFYQKVIGPVISGHGRCPMYPTCSQYSVEAIRKHGPAIGIIMTADRLIHEGDEQRYAPLISIGDRNRFFDPVKKNDFWWSPE